VTTRALTTPRMTRPTVCISSRSTDANDKRATSRIWGATGEAFGLFGNRTRQLDQGSFQDTFQPFQRHVYRITGTPGD